MFPHLKKKKQDNITFISTDIGSVCSMLCGWNFELSVYPLFSVSSPDKEIFKLEKTKALIFTVITQHDCIIKWSICGDEKHLSMAQSILLSVIVHTGMS